MMTIKFLGVNRIDFQPQGSDRVMGFKIHFAIPADHGVGLVGSTFFLSDASFLDLFGSDGLNYLGSHVLEDCSVSSFGRRLAGISFSSSKK